MSSTGKWRPSDSPYPPATPLGSRKRSNSQVNTVTPSYDFTQTPLPSHRLEKSATTTPRLSKRRKENELPGPSGTLPPKARSYTPRRSNADKLELVFTSLRSVGWTLGEFLFFTFRTKDDDGNELSRSVQNAMYATHFLQGHTKYTAATILDLWFHSPDSRVGSDTDHHSLMYSTATLYTEIKPARAALTAFATQIVEKKLVAEAKVAVRPSSGLHATLKKRGSQKAEWADIGSNTVSRVMNTIKQHQPLLWYYTNKVAEGKGNVHAVKRRRPTETVCTHVISTLNFTRNNEARLLPLARGLLYFAFSAPADLMAYGSRIGDMPAYSTVYGSLKGLAVHEAALTLEHARDPTKWGFLQFDNVQNYTRQRDHRIGRVNKMNIGIAATYCELEGVDISGADLDDKRRRVAENKRAELTVEELLAMIDQKHLDTVFTLHWLRALINSIPELSCWKEHVSMMFREKAQKFRLPAKPTKIHPLASSGKNETITTELKDSLYDFLGQLGHTDGDYIRRILVVGGDGLSFQKILEIQRYLQFHEDPFQSLELVEPALSTWHAEWTDLSRIFEVHWDNSLSRDPSSLGHSATQIGRPTPPNLKKVDHYTSAELMYLVLEVRMLDCWRNHFKCVDIFEYFKTLTASKSLPEIEDLIPIARKLHRAFSSTRAIYHALSDTTAITSWTEAVPIGSNWTPPPVIASSQSLAPPVATKRKTRKKSNPTSSRHPKGDRVLANSITFMRDALMSRELSYAIAEGDVGRVYEVMKVLLFTFAGSTHSKYTSYLLETISRLELESSPALRQSILAATLVNLTGQEGSFTTADFMQEFFNRLLEAIVEKKGVEYGDTFIRDVIARNLHHFARIKLELRVGVGLAKRSGRHAAPHVNPEVQTLLQVYHEHELHRRRPGCVFKDDDKDDFDKGISKLQSTKLKRWIHETTTTRGLLLKDVSLSQPADLGVSSDSDDLDSDDKEPETICPLLQFPEVVDGQLIFREMENLSDTVDEFLSQFEGSDMVHEAPTSESDMDIDE